MAVYRRTSPYWTDPETHRRNVERGRQLVERNRILSDAQRQQFIYTAVAEGFAFTPLTYCIRHG